MNTPPSKTAPLHIQAQPPVMAIDDRRGTGGMLLFIATEAMLFVLLFFSYVYMAEGHWVWLQEEPPKLKLALPMLGILLLSSVVLHWGERRVRNGASGRGRAALAGTVALGLGFVGLQVLEHRDHLKTLTPNVSKSSFLNDLTMDDAGRVLLTDTGITFTPKGPQQQGSDTVYRFEFSGTPTAIAQGSDLHGPNGIVASPEGLIVAAFSGDEVYRLKQEGRKVIAKLPKGQLDGLVRLDNGGLLVTSWRAKGIYYVTPEGEANLVVQNVTSPASIDYDTKRHRILIPLLQANQVRFEPWQPPSP